MSFEQEVVDSYEEALAEVLEKYYVYEDEGELYDVNSLKKELDELAKYNSFWNYLDLLVNDEEAWWDQTVEGYVDCLCEDIKNEIAYDIVKK